MGENRLKLVADLQDEFPEKEKFKYYREIEADRILEFLGVICVDYLACWKRQPEVYAFDRLCGELLKGKLADREFEDFGKKIREIAALDMGSYDAKVAELMDSFALLGAEVYNHLVADQSDKNILYEKIAKVMNWNCIVVQMKNPNKPKKFSNSPEYRDIYVFETNVAYLFLYPDQSVQTSIWVDLSMTFSFPIAKSASEQVTVAMISLEDELNIKIAQLFSDFKAEVTRLVILGAKVQLLLGSNEDNINLASIKNSTLEQAQASLQELISPLFERLRSISSAFKEEDLPLYYIFDDIPTLHVGCCLYCFEMNLLTEFPCQCVACIKCKEKYGQCPKCAQPSDPKVSKREQYRNNPSQCMSCGEEYDSPLLANFSCTCRVCAFCLTNKCPACLEVLADEDTQIKENLIYSKQGGEFCSGCNLGLPLLCNCRCEKCAKSYFDYYTRVCSSCNAEIPNHIHEQWKKQFTECNYCNSLKPHSDVVTLPCSCSVCTTCIEASGHPTLPRCPFCLRFFNEQERIYLKNTVSNQVRSVIEYSPYCLECYKTSELACECACTDHADKHGESCTTCRTVFARQPSPQRIVNQSQYQTPAYPIQPQFQIPQMNQSQYQTPAHPIQPQFQIPQMNQSQYQTPVHRIQPNSKISQMMSQINQLHGMNPSMPSPMSQIIVCYRCGVYCLCTLICGRCYLCRGCLASNIHKCPICEMVYTAMQIQQLYRLLQINTR